MIPRAFNSKAEVISFVNGLGIEEAILMGNLWLEVKNKVTALELDDIIIAKEAEKLKAIAEKEKELLVIKEQEVKALETSIKAKETEILRKDDDIKRWTSEVSKKEEEKLKIEEAMKEQLMKKENEVAQCKLQMQKKEEDMSEVRIQFNAERQEIKLEKERALEDMRMRFTSENEQNTKQMLRLQSYADAKEEELTKTRQANENFIINKFETTFGRFIDKTSRTSAGTGIIGEEFVQQVLAKIWDGFGIHYENVARYGHQGDFKVIFPKSHISILLEVKNFADSQSSLPKKDLDKFFLDLKDSTYHAGILLSLNSQCKTDVEDFNVLDDPKSQKKFMFLSKFACSVKEDHEFVLKLALGALANTVENGRTRTQYDESRQEMLAFIKSQLEFARMQFKAAQGAEKEIRKIVSNLTDDINRITRQIANWEAPKMAGCKRSLGEIDDQDFCSATKSSKKQGNKSPNTTTPSRNFGTLPQLPLSSSGPGSPWEKRNLANTNGGNNPASPRTPTTVRPPMAPLSNATAFHGTVRTPEKHTSIMNAPITSLTATDKTTTITDDHGFLRFAKTPSNISNNYKQTPLTNVTGEVAESRTTHKQGADVAVLSNDTDDLFKDFSF